MENDKYNCKNSDFKITIIYSYKTNVLIDKLLFFIFNKLVNTKLII